MANSADFRGTGVAMITPFTMDGAIDFPTLETHTDQLIKHGVDYLVVLGTTAETPTLSKQEKIDIINVTKDINNGRVPYVVGAGGNNTSDVIQWMETIGSEGIDGYLSVVPYYNKPTQTGMKQHFSAIAASSDIPLILYNVPGRTGSNMTADTVLELAHMLGDKVAGVKEASGDFTQIMEIVRQKPEEFRVFSGDDAIALPMISVGCEGLISVIGNALPKLVSDMIRGALSGKFDEAMEQHYTLLPLMGAIFKEGNPTGVKALMEILGFGTNNLRLPLLPATEVLYKELEKMVAGLTQG